MTTWGGGREIIATRRTWTAGSKIWNVTAAWLNMQSAGVWRYVMECVVFDVSNVTCVFIFRVKQCNQTVDVYRPQPRNDKLIDHTKHSITSTAVQDSSTVKQPENLLLQPQTSPHGVSVSQPKLRCFPSHPITCSSVSALSSHTFVDPVVVSLVYLETQTTHNCLNKTACNEHSTSCIHSTPQYYGNNRSCGKLHFAHCWFRHVWVFW
jgi:hypothetical protein